MEKTHQSVEKTVEQRASSSGGNQAKKMGLYIMTFVGAGFLIWGLAQDAKANSPGLNNITLGIVFANTGSYILQKMKENNS